GRRLPRAAGRPGRRELRPRLATGLATGPGGGATARRRGAGRGRGPGAGAGARPAGRPGGHTHPLDLPRRRAAALISTVDQVRPPHVPPATTTPASAELRTSFPS